MKTRITDSIRFLATLAIMTAVLAGPGAIAQTDGTAGSPDALRLATGKHGKGYSKLFADIQAVCGNQVELSEVETEGGLQNLTTLSANKAEIGFAQLDTLQEMKASDEAIGALQAVIPINMNLLHIVAHKEPFLTEGPKRLGGLMVGATIEMEIDRFSDLRNLPVAVVGSARSLGRVLDRKYGMGMKFVDVDTDEQALDKLARGKVAGMLSTSGWPSGPIEKLKRNSGYRLLPFDLAVQPPYQLVRKNYENLDAFNREFLAIPNLLVSRPFSANGANGRAVVTLQSCIQKNLVRLQDGKFEPAWRDVKNVNDTFGWPRLVAAKR